MPLWCQVVEKNPIWDQKWYYINLLLDDRISINLYRINNYLEYCWAPFMMRTSLSPRTSVKSLEMMSSGQIVNLISSWTSPCPSTPPPTNLNIFLYNNNIYSPCPSSPPPTNLNIFLYNNNIYSSWPWTPPPTKLRGLFSCNSNVNLKIV